MGAPGSARVKQNADKHRALFLNVAQTATVSCLELLDTRASGLSQEEVDERRLRFGLNEIAQERSRWQTQLRRALINPFNILLGLLSGVSYATDDIKGAITLGAMVVISVPLTFIRRISLQSAAESLKNGTKPGLGGAPARPHYE